MTVSTDKEEKDCGECVHFRNTGLGSMKVCMNRKSDHYGHVMRNFHSACDNISDERNEYIGPQNKKEPTMTLIEALEHVRYIAELGEVA